MFSDFFPALDTVRARFGATTDSSIATLRSILDRVSQPVRVGWFSWFSSVFFFSGFRQELSLACSGQTAPQDHTEARRGGGKMIFWRAFEPSWEREERERGGE